VPTAPPLPLELPPLPLELPPLPLEVPPLPLEVPPLPLEVPPLPPVPLAMPPVPPLLPPLPDVAGPSPLDAHPANISMATRALLRIFVWLRIGPPSDVNCCGVPAPGAELPTLDEFAYPPGKGDDVRRVVPESTAPA
jgi:hypothetical protein